MDTRTSDFRSEEGLDEALQGARDAVHKHANDAIAILVEVADAHGAETIGKTLRIIHDELASDEFAILFGGFFCTGKSTLLNAILGTPEIKIEGVEKAGVLPVGHFPTTAVLTDIIYAEEPYARVWYRDGTFEVWSFSRFIEEGRVKRTERENAAFFDPIRQFEVGLPISLLKAGVRLRDSPGIADSDFRGQIIREILLFSDAAVQVFSSQAYAGKDERSFADAVEDSGCRTFKVVNLFGDEQSPDEEEVRVFWWSRLIGERDGSVPTLEEFHAQGIFFVDAQKAATGRLGGDMEAVRESGILEVESALGDYLIHAGFEAHAGKFLRETERAANGLTESIHTQRKALRMNAVELKQVISGPKPQIELLKAQRGSLEKVIKAHKQVVIVAGKNAFRTFVNGLEGAVGPQLDKRPMKTLKGFGGVWVAVSKKKREAIAKELVGHLTELIEQETKRWSRAEPPAPGLQEDLSPAFEEMARAVEKPVRRIDEALLEGRVGDKERIGSVHINVSEMIATELAAQSNRRIAFGLGIGGALSAVLVATVGAKLSVAIALAIVSAVGAAINPVVILGVIVAARSGVRGAAGHLSIHSIEKSVKKAGLEAAVEHLRTNLEVSDMIGSGVEKVYADITDPIVRIVGQAIDGEEEQLRVFMNTYEAQRTDVERSIEALESRSERIEEARIYIREARNALKQLG